MKVAMKKVVMKKVAMKVAVLKVRSVVSVASLAFALTGAFCGYANTPLPDPVDGVITLTVDSGSVTYEGAVPSNVRLVKDGVGTAILATESSASCVTTEVAQGVLKVTQPTAIGKSGALAVTSGATYYVAYTTAVNQGTEYHKNIAITIAGTGYDNQGAIRVSFSGASGQKFNDATFRYMTLADDATICTDSRCGLSMWGKLSLNGHTLTKTGSSTLTFTGSTTVDGTVGGHVVIAKGSALMQSVTTFSGTAANTFTFKNGTVLNNYQWSLNSNCAWTWKVEGSVRNDVTTTSSAMNYYGTWDLAGTLRIVNSSIVPVDIRARVTGTGCLVNEGTQPTRLINEANDWTGGVIASNGCIVAAAPATFPNWDTQPELYRAASKGMIGLNVGKPLVTGGNVWQETDVKAAIKKISEAFAYDPAVALYTDSGVTTNLAYALDAGFLHTGEGTLTFSGSVPSLKNIVNDTGLLRLDADTPLTLGTLASRSVKGMLEIVGGTYNATSILAGATLPLNGASVNYPGVIRQTGGSVTGTRVKPSTSLMHDTPYQAGGFAHGAYLMEGGELTLGWTLMVGHYPNLFGAFYQTGGIVRVSDGGVICGTNGREVYYVGGGTNESMGTSGSFCVGYDGASPIVSQYSQCCVEGDRSVLKTRDMVLCNRVQGQHPAMTGVVAVVDGGTFAAQRFRAAKDSPVKPGRRACVYVSGGVMKPLLSGRWADTADTVNHRDLPEVFTVGPDGMTIDLTSANGNVEFPYHLTPPSGKSVVAATLPAASAVDATGKNKKFSAQVYRMPGEIRIIGKGLAATGTAVYDPAQGKLTGVKIFAPGNDYDETTKVRLYLPNNNSLYYECSYTLATLTGGGVTCRAGTRTLTLSGTNTYAGATRVESGTLCVTEKAFPAGSALYVATNAVFNANGVARTVSTLTGGGSITGDITVTQGVAFDTDRLTGEKGTMTISGTLTFGADATVFSSEAALPAASRLNLVRAEGGIVGFDPAKVSLPAPWQAALLEGGKKIAVYRPIGVMMLVQ